MKLIDAHIHVDQYNIEERKLVLDQLGHSVLGVIAVSMNEESCKINLELSRENKGKYYPAFGYHPELSLPDEEEVEHLFNWIREHQDEAVAIGEVGLPYYKRTEAEGQGRFFDLKPYMVLLEQFMIVAEQLNKPIVLHAIYEDADMVCDLLEKHGVTAAHFHWFKGAKHTIQRMADKGYYVSISPDVCYEEEIKDIVRWYPIEQLMVETDGPWPFEGPFTGQTTLPSMIRKSVAAIAELKGMDRIETSEILYENTKRFYRI